MCRLSMGCLISDRAKYKVAQCSAVTVPVQVNSRRARGLRRIAGNVRMLGGDR
jgi:hypothetical protein